MLYGFVPKWLEKIERHARWLAIPNLALLLVGLQVLGFILVYLDPKWWDLLVLHPPLILQGELWRLVSFLAVPYSMNPLWMFLALNFLYFIVNGVESEWGEFRTMFYVTVCMGLTVAFCFAFGYSLASPGYLQSTLFFAAATIAPECEILLFFILPVKLKWLAWVSLVFIGLAFISGSWLDRLYLIVIYANYLLFFGPYYAWQLKQRQRRRKFKRQSDEPEEEQ